MPTCSETSGSRNLKKNVPLARALTDLASDSSDKQARLLTEVRLVSPLLKKESNHQLREELIDLQTLKFQLLFALGRAQHSTQAIATQAQLLIALARAEQSIEAESNLQAVAI